MNYKSLTGVRDVLPDEQPYWTTIEKKINEITHLYGYQRVEPPILEETALFIRGVGDTTDIVEKEMYSFIDKGDNYVTMRPEFTAGFMRLYLEHGMHKLPKPVKLYTMGPIFRYEKPQAGRFRQHTQFNVEAIGEQDPALDLEVMSIAWQLYAELGFKGLKFQLNSTGCPVCRPAYIEKLHRYYRQYSETICHDCKRRLERNALRLLDCKKEQCQPVIARAPVISEHLCQECDEHFAALKSYLTLTTRPYEVNHRLVRGLDYYTKTVFEVWAQGIGAQSAMCGGGRYDGLIEQLGGEPTPGIGFGSGIERIIMSMKEQGIAPTPIPSPPVYIAHFGETARNTAIKLTFSLREHQMGAIMSFGSKSIKAMMRHAHRSNARFVLLVGEDEVERNVVAVKDMQSGEQTDVPIDDVFIFLTEHLN
ncbi:histidine--tRNA ligase [candidate division KSB1 bacterium]|nr:histidine--tRNA ligase [candidate division KSB1 bacterium]RQW06732.1 MAG: histidine--tRNA ligase [candidate division KSB1 bacterium]